MQHGGEIPRHSTSNDVGLACSQQDVPEICQNFERVKFGNFETVNFYCGFLCLLARTTSSVGMAAEKEGC